jgi:hypothetical protein
MRRSTTATAGGRATPAISASKEFPRLTDANLPAGVGDIGYSIIADDLGSYEIGADEVAALVEAIGG